MYYTKQYNRTKRGLRRFILFLVLVLTAFFSYGVIQMLEIDSLQPAYSIDDKSNKNSNSGEVAQMHLTEMMPLFAKLRSDESGIYYSTQVE